VAPGDSSTTASVPANPSTAPQHTTSSRRSARQNLAARTQAARVAHVASRAQRSGSTEDGAASTGFIPPPPFEDAQRAHLDLVAILAPRRGNGQGHSAFEGDEVLRKRLGMMRQHLWLYTHPDEQERLGWQHASEKAASINERSRWTAKHLRQWSRRFLDDREDLPFSLNGAWKKSMLDRSEGLVQAIHLHLQSLGPYICAMDIVRYLGDPEVQQEHGLTHGISLATAKRWLEAMDYRWSKTPKGEHLHHYGLPLCPTH
jgi:hypothetical protein